MSRLNLPVLQAPPGSHHVLHRSGLVFAATWTLGGLGRLGAPAGQLVWSVDDAGRWADLLSFLYLDDPAWFLLSRLLSALATCCPSRMVRSGAR